MASNTVVLKGNLKVRIRWAQHDDASDIARLELDSSRFENRAVPFMFTHQQFTSLWENRLSEQNYKTVLACGAKSLYGFITFKDKIESGKILALYIDPLYMRHGIGRMLLQTAEQMVRLKGGCSLEVDVEVLNNGAIEFYRSLHFKKVSVKLDHLIVMRKELYNA
ncbi:MAG: GNAT family N-acetyltransferase [Succinivibrio sp.]